MISIGVDIGAFSIKIAEVEATSKSYVIRRIEEFPLSLDLTKDKKIEVIDTLRTFFQHYDPERTTFVFALPQKYVSGRLVNLPFRERFKVQKAIVPQLEDELPFSMEDAIFEAKIVKYAGKGASVLAMAVPKERIADVLGMAHDCGIEPSVISTEGLGINNLFERWMNPPFEGPSIEQEIPSDRPAELVVNIGHLSTELLVYSDGCLIGVRNVDWGAKNMADAIGQKYGLNYIQAIRELQTKGFIMLDKAQGTREQATFSETIESSVNVLVAEMKLKLLELQSELHLQWSKGHLLGGGSQLKNLGAFLTQQFEIPFNRYKQFENHPAVSFDVSSHIELVAGPAVGLALEGLRRPRNPATNFLKGEFAQQSHFFEAMWEKWGHTAQLAAIAFIVLLVYGMIRDGLAQSLLEKSDAVLKTQAQAIANMRGSISPSKIRSFISNQEKLEKTRKAAEKVTYINSALDILNLISAAMPPGANVPMEIKRVSIDNDKAEVHGYTINDSSRDLIFRALKTLAQGNVSNTEVKIKIPAGKTGFAYKFNVNRFSGG